MQQQKHLVKHRAHIPRPLFIAVMGVILLPLFSHNNQTIAAGYALENVTTYEVGESGITSVTQKTLFKNLEDKVIIPQYSLSLSFQSVENVRASKESSALDVAVNKTSGSVTISPNLDKFVVPAQGSLGWTLQYETKEVARKEGQIWEIVIPYKQNNTGNSTDKVLLKVPKTMGEENYISPDPSNVEESEAYHIYTYNHLNADQKTIDASFGGVQFYHYSLKYHLENPTAEKVYTEITLPADKENQEVYFDTLEPIPTGIRVDADGNYLARYELNPNQKADVELQGRVKLFPKKYRTTDSGNNAISAELSPYLAPQKYWEADNTLIQKKAQELTDDSKTVIENSTALFKFVTSYLKYNTSKANGKSERLGAVGALNNPTEAVCMEFTDLYIALSRAAGIPAREVDGFAYAPSAEFKPDLYDILHSWVEIYVPSLGWLQIDPTWSAPPSTIELFSQFDAKHIAFSTKGLSSETPYPAGSYKTEAKEMGDVKVEVIDAFSDTQPDVDVTYIFDGTKNTGVWNKGVIYIENPGPKTIYNLRINYENKNMTLDLSESKVDIMPPFSHYTVTVQYKSNSFWTNKNGVVTSNISFADYTKSAFRNGIAHEVEFTPLWISFMLPLSLFAIVFIVFMLIIHLVQYVEKRPRRNHS